MTGSVAGLMCAHAEQLTFYFTSQRFEYIEWKLLFGLGISFLVAGRITIIEVQPSAGHC